MRTNWLAVVVGMAITLSASAQTMPASRPTDDYPALRKRIAELQTENQSLREQVALLVRRLDEALALIPKAAEPHTAAGLRQVALEQIKLGMKQGEIVDLLGQPRKRSAADDGEVWTYVGTDPSRDVDNGRQTVTPGAYELYLLFDADGVLLRKRDYQAPSTTSPGPNANRPQPGPGSNTPTGGRGRAR